MGPRSSFLVLDIYQIIRIYTMTRDIFYFTGMIYNSPRCTGKGWYMLLLEGDAAGD